LVFIAKLVSPAVDVDVGFNHSFEAAKIERAPASSLAENGAERWVIQQARERRSQVPRIADAEHQARVAQQLSESPEVRSDDG
jgi:hypothetical protein